MTGPLANSACLTPLDGHSVRKHTHRGCFVWDLACWVITCEHKDISMTSVLWLKFVKSFSFLRPCRGVNWFLIYSFYEWYLLCVLSSFYSAILPFQAGKPLFRRNCFFCWALVQLTAVICKHYTWICVFRTRQFWRALIFILAHAGNALEPETPTVAGITSRSDAPPLRTAPTWACGLRTLLSVQ